MRVELRGRICDRQAAWGRLADTDLLNRLAGNGAVQMRLQSSGRGAPPTVLGTMESLFGPMSFTEISHAWVCERWFTQERLFDSAILARTLFRLDLTEEGRGVLPHLVLEVQPASRWSAPAVNARISAVARRWQKLLDDLPAPGEPDRSLSRALPPEARAAVERWRSEADARVVSAVERLLVTGSALELQKIRPFAIADRFSLDRHETLVALLRSVSAGVLELVWTVRCERCSGAVARASSLSDLSDHADCPSCEISSSVDLAETVEVVFAPHPSIVPRLEERFCTVFPAGSPETRCALRLPAGGSLREQVDLPRGRYRLGCGQGSPDLEIEASDEGAQRSLRWRPGTMGVQKVAPGRVEVELDNDPDTERRVLLLHQGPVAPPVAASEVAQLAEFRKSFGPAALSRSARISARSVALLFTDLSGSTALYEALGDAVAYGLVRDHFELLGRIVDEHQGMVVKTIGDAVMASFSSGTAALQAAFAMREAFQAWIASQDLQPRPSLNVGLHVGPALAVHSDTSGLDWFGRTVNLAARAQSAARDGALVLTAETARQPPIAALLAERGVEQQPFQAELKGIGLVDLVRIPP